MEARSDHLPFHLELLEKHRTEKPGETEAVAAGLWDRYFSRHANSILLLDGQMGAGKTTFVHGFSGPLQFTGAINSPSFNLCNLYDGKKGVLLHYDLYRLTGSTGVVDLGFPEDWTEVPADGKPRLHAIEWWSRALDLFPLPVETYLLRIRDSGDTESGKQPLERRYIEFYACKPDRPRH